MLYCIRSKSQQRSHPENVAYFWTEMTSRSLKRWRWMSVKEIFESEPTLVSCLKGPSCNKKRPFTTSGSNWREENQNTSVFFGSFCCIYLDTGTESGLMLDSISTSEKRQHIFETLTLLKSSSTSRHTSSSICFILRTPSLHSTMTCSGTEKL